jgi:uncharacterized membrane protein YcgQ (UPF0703/DUF1980 family)
MKPISKYLAPLTLAEWGAIMLYFYFSGRIAAFLHPNFRALVLVTGILLVLTAAVLLIWGNEAPCVHEHEHEHEDDHDHGTCGHDHHEHEHASCEHDHEHEHGRDHKHEHDHAHGQLTFGGAFAFLVLLLPVALAVKVSPDSYGETLIRNRGTIENVASLPGVATRMQKRAAANTQPAPAPVFTGMPETDALEAPPPATSNPQRFPGQSIAGQTEPPPPRGIDEDYPLPTKSVPDVKPMPKSAGNAPQRPADRGTARAQPQLFDPVTQQEAGTIGGAYENPFLKPNADGNIKVEVIDLMYGAVDATARKDFDGKRVEMIGQFVPATGRLASPSTFKLTRLFMVCCAADVQPISVQIKSEDSLGKYKPMSWVKVVGRVTFPTVGDRPSPLVTAERIVLVDAPEEKYLY